ncbi:MAG: sensor histidine kinase, partial [Pseudomonadota bacterium]
IDLTALTRRLLTRLAPLSEMRDIALHMDDASPAPVMGDAVLIESALRNLVENALKYASDDTRVDVRVRIYGDWVRVEIVDEGPGLPVTDGGPLHERFVRGPNAADTVGSGLGLAIAHEVALAHGGELHLTGRSDERSGTCAALLLPSV